MTRKDFYETVKKTVQTQVDSAQNRFDTTEGILLNALPATPKKLRLKVSAVDRIMFSMPPEDSALIEVLRRTAAQGSRHSTTKSEIIRAGLHALNALEARSLVVMLDNLRKVPRRS